MLGLEDVRFWAVVEPENQMCPPSKAGKPPLFARDGTGCMFPRLLPLLITLGNKLIGKSIDIVIAFDVRKTNIVFRHPDSLPDAKERTSCPAACPR
jgi:hypothetical protein